MKAFLYPPCTFFGCVNGEEELLEMIFYREVISRKAEIFGRKLRSFENWTKFKDIGVAPKLASDR